MVVFGDGFWRWLFWRWLFWRMGKTAPSYFYTTSLADIIATPQYGVQHVWCKCTACGMWPQPTSLYTISIHTPCKTNCSIHAKTCKITTTSFVHAHVSYLSHARIEVFDQDLLQRYKHDGGRSGAIATVPRADEMGKATWCVLMDSKLHGCGV